MHKHKFIAIILTIYLLFFCPSCQKEDLNNLDELIYVRHKGCDMPAYVYGNASEKVFIITLHGGPGGFGLAMRASSMKNIIEKSYAVVYLDQRGHGTSQGQYSDDEFNIDIMAGDVMALVKVLQHKYGNDSRFFLMGHSWGGLLGTSVLINEANQSCFSGWINISGIYDISDLYREMIKVENEVAEEQIEEGNHVDYWQGITIGMQSRDTVNFSWDDGYYMNDKAREGIEILLQDAIINVDGIEAGLDFLFQNNLFTISWNSSNIRIEDIVSIDLSYKAKLENISIPSLYLSGKYDLVCPPSIGLMAYERINSVNKKFVLFEKSAHAPMVAEPDKFANEVLGFIDQNK